MKNQIIDEHVFCFSIDQLKIGLFLKNIYRAIRAVEVKPLPDAPEIVSGIINLGGKVIPVVNFRKRLKLRDKVISPSDIIIVVYSDSLDFCFFANEIIGLKMLNHKSYSVSNSIIPKVGEVIEGVAVIEDEMILIHDVNKFLLFEEEEQLKKALESGRK